MKRNLLFAICLIIAGIFDVSAQRKVYFTPKVGLNITNITNTQGDWKSGTNLGMGVEWLIKPKIGIETGLYYSEYGTKNIDIPSLNHKQMVELSYIQMPIAVKYYLFKGFNIFAGPQFNYKIDEKVKPVYTTITYNKDFALNGLAGLGYQFDFGLTFSVNYVLGITSVGQPIFAANNNTYNRRNYAYQFNVGWRF
ncbi:MAG: PorT family protein [Bacteroidales bacterium]|jgi:opacity protein-like surface antigen|nr:PorT family protein [Bacteroidales bacterium]